MSAQPAPPSGHPPPERAQLDDGTVLDLRELATEICRRYRAAYPDEDGRYGDAGVAWCVHDNQHLLNWAVIEARGFGAMDADVRWLAGILAARDFPLDRLARTLELAADVIAEAGRDDVAARLRSATGVALAPPGR